jgi:multiple sugar transport system permease protein
MAATLTRETTRRRPTAAVSSWMDRHARWLLVSPAVFLVLALSIFPLLFALWVNFVEFDFSVSNSHPWVGLQNFRDNFNDPDWWHSIEITAILA